jgi:hypothetical protein
MRRLAVVLAGAALVTAGCSNGVTATGTVTGSYLREGGPALASGIVPLSGTISFQGAGGPAIMLNSDRTGKFTGQLPAGTYTVTAESSSIGGTCSRPLTTKVQAGKTITITVICDIS